jgi:hypothetical protein
MSRLQPDEIERWMDALVAPAIEAPDDDFEPPPLVEPQVQAVGYWLARQADENGVIDNIDWDQLAVLSGLHHKTVRIHLQSGRPLLDRGLVTREDRTIGNQKLKPLFRINLP